MNKEQLIEKTRKYYRQLQQEQEKDNGFPEFSQFCEEFLWDLIPNMTSKQLLDFICEMKEITYIGLDD